MYIIYVNEKEDTVEMHIDADTPEGVSFNGMHLHSMMGHRLKFNGASFVSCFLWGAYMFDAEAMNVDFTNAVLGQFNLRKSKVCGSIFRNCDMTVGYFEGADFSGADLTGARMLDTHFENCNLCGAIMLGEELESSIFTGAKFDKHTVWPKGFNPLEHGAILVEDETA
jgi:uncharacterized protein YjbI with pentapeptide repeats